MENETNYGSKKRRRKLTAENVIDSNTIENDYVSLNPEEAAPLINEIDVEVMKDLGTLPIMQSDKKIGRGPSAISQWGKK